MATSSFLLLHLLSLFVFIPPSVSVRVPAFPLNLLYHRGPLLSTAQPLQLYLTFYGDFEPSERFTLKAFLASLNPNSFPLHRRSMRGSLFPVVDPPSVALWWSLTRRYSDLQGRHVSQTFEIAAEVDDNYSLGTQLTASDIATLARSSAEILTPSNSLSLVFTSADVVVEGFCMHACGGHSSFYNSIQEDHNDESVTSIPYLWVGNPKLQCPGFCAWPFARQQYGPPMEPLKAPNGVGVDGMVITMAKLLVGAATNPLGEGYFEGDDTSYGREAGEVCAGKFGCGAYPGYPGKLLQNPKSGASYNMEGSHGMKFLVPWIWDPATRDCGGQP